MAERSFWDKLWGFDEPEERKEEPEKQQEKTLQDAIHFVAELQSYYYNDVCKMQASVLTMQELSEARLEFINKKVKQDNIALSQIDDILKELQDQEVKFQAVAGKSVYSFFTEVEQKERQKARGEAFKILANLCAINTKPELDDIIRKRVEEYKASWNISQEIAIPTNSNAILVEEENGVEQYQIGSFVKKVNPTTGKYVLSSKQLEQIRNLKFQFESFGSSDAVWVHVASCTRAQLNRMRRTCIIDNEWEHVTEVEKGALYFDVVAVKDLEQYLKGILQIVLKRTTYSVIAIFNPTSDMLNLIGSVKVQGNKVIVTKKYPFYLRERSGIYGNNLTTARIDRRNIPEALQFIPYPEFKRMYF